MSFVNPAPSPQSDLPTLVSVRTTCKREEGKKGPRRRRSVCTVWGSCGGGVCVRYGGAKRDRGRALAGLAAGDRAKNALGRGSNPHPHKKITISLGTPSPTRPDRRRADSPFPSLPPLHTPPHPLCFPTKAGSIF